MIDPKKHVVFRLRNATVSHYPYSHFYVENVFPPDFYAELLANLPNDSYSESGTNYHGRQFADPSAISILSFMHTQEFMQSVIQVFAHEIRMKYHSDRGVQITHDLRLVRDKQAYQIGPHTDAAWKLVSLLFYLPPDNSLESLGTSIYMPKDASFECKGGPHHKFDAFNQVWTAPFRPNSCFGFFRTNTSFHGVEPITIPCERNVLLYNLYSKT